MRHTPTFPQNPADLSPFIDHTLLKATATAATIETLCKEAVENNFYAVCVNGAHVGTAKKSLQGTSVRIAAVIGFPLGAMTSAAKAFEAANAAEEGATEIDMVMRIDLAKTNQYSALRKDIASVVKAVENRAIVKVILETSLLTPDEIANSARAADEAGAHFVKTCTGFSTSGAPAGVATVEHVTIMRANVRDHVQVKASGGIRDFVTAQNLIRAGATRLGTSSGVTLVRGDQVKSGY